MTSYRMYGDLASWWPLLSPPDHYAEEVEAFVAVLQGAGIGAGSTGLELGSGGGHNALYLKRHLSPLVLSDLSPQMLAMSAGLNPDCEHIQGDMRDLRLERQFDAVFIHDAITYITSAGDLARVMETAWTHLRPGGVVLIAPDGLRDDFQSTTTHGGSDQGQRSMRYMEWIYDPDEADCTCVSEFVFVLRTAGKPVEVVHEQHHHGHFYRREWLDLLDSQGFAVTTQRDRWKRTLFIGRRPA